MTELYKMFAHDWEHLLDFSEDSLIEMYYGEVHGEPISPTNGYNVGKTYLSVNVAMWKEDIPKGLLFKKELYEDPKFPHWWLDSIFEEK